MSHVLVVENDPDTLEAVREVLEDDGHDVRSAENGEEAIQQLNRDDVPRLIILDTWMPRMNGSDFLDWLGEHPQLADVPVVVVSGDTGVFNHPRASVVLEKPYDVDQLLAIVRQFCG